ncbi:MAG: MFS transporter [Chloroflexi bacterium]|nr:MFS transporter [Chloroflexota bacterium]
MRSQQAGEVSRKPIAESPVGTGPPPGLAGTAKRSLGSTFASLAVPNYRLMFQGNFVTHLGFGMQQVAFGWLILELTNDPFYLGLGGFTMMFPMLVISPFGGIIADRFPRQRVLMASQSLLMAIAVLLAALVYFRLATVWHLLALSFLNGTLMSLNVPSRNALLSDIVGRDLLANAISLYSLSLNVSRIAGPSLAGAIIGAVGTFACFLFQAFGYVWSVANIAMMKVPARPLAARQFSVMQNLVEGFRYCYRTPLVFSMLLLGSAVSILAMPAYMQLLPAYARDTLGLGPEGLGLLMSVAGIGALTSSFGLVLAGRFRRRGLLQLGAALTMGVLLCALAMIRWVPLASLALAGVSAGSSIMMILNNTVLQEVVPDHLRGRVMSVYMITWGIMPLGAVPLGAIAARWSTPTAMLIGGAGCVAAALWIGLTRPEIRQV